MNALALSTLACAAHATIVLLPQFSARAYIEAIGRYRATWLTAVPPMIAMMLRERDLLARAENLADRQVAGSVIVNEGNGRFFEPAPGRGWLLAMRPRCRR